MRVALLQPCYPHGKSQTYLPGGLMNLGSRLIQAGIQVFFADLNHQSLSSTAAQEELAGCDAIGWSVLGPPYIPSVADDSERLRKSFPLLPILVGGEGVARLNAKDFQAWFGNSEAIQVRTDRDIEQVLDLAPGALQGSFETSATPMLRQLDPEALYAYLRNEFALFMSNGCAFNCSFCAAAKGRREQYRSLESLEDEVEFISSFLASRGGTKLSAYLTNLDTFQNVEELEPRVAAISRIARRHGLEPCLRGLATSRCTFVACRKDPQLLRRLRANGLKIVAFGADGGSEETWRRENKKHNVMSELEEVVRKMKEADITPELLMVIGFQDDSKKALLADLRFSFRQALRGAVIRPYLAKSRTPSGRWPEGDRQVERFRDDRELLTRLDYAMLGSAETHPDRIMRWLSNATYLAIIAALAPFGKCPTSPLLPVPKRGLGRSLAMAANRLMPFDR